MNLRSQMVQEQIQSRLVSVTQVIGHFWDEIVTELPKCYYFILKLTHYLCYRTMRHLTIILHDYVVMIKLLLIVNNSCTSQNLGIFSKTAICKLDFWSHYRSRLFLKETITLSQNKVGIGKTEQNKAISMSEAAQRHSEAL